MHDQKLTDEFEFYRSSPDYLAFMYEHEKPQRNRQADRLFRSGMVQTAYHLIMLDLLRYMKKPIDHPYLLPPASGQVYWLTGSGRTERYSDGSTIHMVFGPWDRENDAIPSQIVPQPPIKVSGPYVIHMHTVDLFPQKVRCAFGLSYYDKEKTKRAPCYLCGRIHD